MAQVRKPARTVVESLSPPRVPPWCHRRDPNPSMEAAAGYSRASLTVPGNPCRSQFPRSRAIPHAEGN
jgi:hypothetical protein